MLRSVETTDTDNSDFKCLFESSFADFEKIPFANLRRTFGKGGVLRLFYDGDRFTGLCYTFERDSTVFLVYIATLPELRGHGYGSEILGLTAEANKGKRLFLVLEKEEGTPEERKLKHRRKEFYHRNGWRDTGVDLLSDGYFFDSMYLGEYIPEDRMKATVRAYENIHNGRSS